MDSDTLSEPETNAELGYDGYSAKLADNDPTGVMPYHKGYEDSARAIRAVCQSLK